MQKFLDKSASIVVADPAAATRLMMTSVLRALGFANVVAMESLTEALGTITQGGVDWLITSLFPEDKVNALHVLGLSLDHAALAHLKVSLYASDAEEAFLQRAFALGLFSSHSKPVNKQSFTANTEALVAAIQRHADSPALVAAEYLRNHLRARCDYENLLQLETKLVATFPEDPALLLHLAESCFELGDDQRGRSLLWQAEERDGSLAERARELGDAYLGKASDRQWEGLRPGVCVVVDPDGAAQNSAAEALNACGAAAVHTFGDGDAFWTWLTANDAPDLIVMEWRIPKISGPTLLQRLRARGLSLPLVLVNTSLIKRRDAPLLEEMGVTTVLEKPTKKNDLLNCLAWVVGQSRRPTEPKSLEGRIRALLASGLGSEAEGLMQVYVAKAQPQDPTRKCLEAEFVLYRKDYPAARELAMLSISLGNKSVVALNVLGKALMQMREFSTALKVFERASEISPSSIERLCAIAETQCELGNDETALATLEKAAGMDAENQAVVGASVNIALATGNAGLAREMIEKIPASESVLAFVNNRAVAFAKAGRFKESIDLYGNALTAVPKSKPNLRAVVLYNLALAQIQQGESAAALKSLAAIEAPGDADFDAKIRSLRRRVQDALRTGQVMRLNQGNDDERTGNIVKMSRKSADGTPAPAVEDRSGGLSHCLHGIYNVSVPANSLVAALEADPPRIGAGRRPA